MCSGPQAAMRYQHHAQGRDRAIAEKMAKLAERNPFVEDTAVRTPRCIGAAKSPIRLEPTRGESRGLINHPGLHIATVRRLIRALGASRISGRTQVNGLSPIQ